MKTLKTLISEEENKQSSEVVNKPKAEEPTADHGNAERGIAGDVTPPTQGSSNTDEFKMALNGQVMHHKLGEGTVLALSLIHISEPTRPY